MTRWLRIANLEAKKSNHSHKLGAVVVKSGRVLGKAANLSKPHGMLCNKGRHAEVRAMGRCNCCTGATLIVTRYRGTCSKPCSDCMEAIIAAGIVEIGYIDWSGNLILEKI